MPSQLYGVGPATDVTISCRVQAFPSAINYWVKDRVSGGTKGRSLCFRAREKCDQLLQEEMLLDGPKYNISEERASQYETVMYLTVRAWRKEDEGHFTCLSTNSLGKAERTIQSYSE